MTKTIVISASAKLQKDICHWVKYFKKNGYEVLDYPVEISKANFLEIYPEVYKKFFKLVTKADILFLLNSDKNGVKGYIGAAGFAEINFAVANKILNKTSQKIYILKIPNKKVHCYDEIKLWLDLGWIEIFKS